MANALVGQGYLSYDDLEVIEPDRLMELGELTPEQVDAIVTQAEERALKQEAIDEREKQLAREKRMAEKAAKELAEKQEAAEKAAAAAAAKEEANKTETQPEGDSDEKTET